MVVYRVGALVLWKARKVDMQAKYDRPQMVRLICEGLNSYQIAARVHVRPRPSAKPRASLNSSRRARISHGGGSFTASG